MCGVNLLSANENWYKMEVQLEAYPQENQKNKNRIFISIKRSVNFSNFKIDKRVLNQRTDLHSNHFFQSDTGSVIGFFLVFSLRLSVNRQSHYL